MKKIIAILFCFLLVSSALPQSIQEKEICGLVGKVVDGDTIVILCLTNTYTIRLADIDAPEKRQQYGLEAKDFVKKLALWKVVTIKYKETDRYGRIIGTVMIGTNGTSVNQELLKNGLAWWYRQYSTNQSMGILEKQAKTSRIGLWASTNNIAPWEYRKLQKNK